MSDRNIVNVFGCLWVVACAVMYFVTSGITAAIFAFLAVLFAIGIAEKARR